jgi:hypothetical protein
VTFRDRLLPEQVPQAPELLVLAQLDTALWTLDIALVAAIPNCSMSWLALAIGLPSRQPVSSPIALTLCAARSNATVASSTPSWLPLRTPTSCRSEVSSKPPRPNSLRRV